MPESPQEPLNPLDQALTNVIQDLIGIESITSANFASPNESMVKDMAKEGRLEELDIKGPTIESWSTSPSETITKDDLILDTSVDNQPLMLANDARNATNTDGERTKNEESLISSCVTNVTSPASVQPVFSIGPFPSSVPPSIVKNVQFSDPLIVGPSNPFFSPVFGSSLSNVSSSFNSSASEEMEAKEKRSTRSLDNVVDSDNVSVDSSSSLETVKEFSTAAGESASSCLPGEIGKRVANLEAGGSVKQEEKKVVGGKNRTPEEVLSAREDRLKRLEEQAKWLMNKMNATNRRGSALSTRLEELHEVYGEPPVPPPMPDVLPSRRLRTTLSDLPRQVRIFYLQKNSFFYKLVEFLVSKYLARVLIFMFAQ